VMTSVPSAELNYKEAWIIDFANLAFVGRDFAEVDADPEPDLPLLWNTDLERLHPLLNLHRAAHGRGGAAEQEEEPIATDL
jgi:hypothetical protein